MSENFIDTTTYNIFYLIERALYCFLGVSYLIFAYKIIKVYNKVTS